MDPHLRQWVGNWEDRKNTNRLRTVGTVVYNVYNITVYVVPLFMPHIYFLSTYYGPGTILGTGETAGTTTDEVFALIGLTS